MEQSGLAKAIRLRAHATVLRRGVVIPSQEVEEPVGEEHRDFIERTFSLLTSLLSGGGNADDHIPERSTRELGKRALLQREGEDIGWTIFSSIDAIELVHARIIGKQE
jgi:hypothetical protein